MIAVTFNRWWKWWRHYGIIKL